MSTLTSADINVGRSSTRRHAPPGGQSSFSINWGNDSHDDVKVVGGKIVTTPAKSAPKKEEEEKVPVVSEEDVTVEVESSASVQAEKDTTVGIVVVKTEASEHVITCTTKALAKKGLTDVILVEVPYASMLVGSSQKLLSTPGVAGVLSLFLAPAHQQAQALSQEAALFQLGNSSAKPVIPGVVCQSSLLEAKGIVPNLAEEWAGSMAGLLEEEDYSAVAKLDPVEVVPLEPSADESDYNTLLKIFRECLKVRGATGIFGLQRKFKIIDDDGSKSLNFEEFSKAIDESALTWSTEQKRSLFDHFDRDGNGSISFDEFLTTLRGQLNDRRKQFVLMAYELLDADKNGVIEVDDISAKYDASKHPDVISGKRSEAQVHREFLDTFDGTEKDGKVTFEEFCNYYGNVSASIDDDDYFELMMRNAWHISGGDGWCANSSCRRVLVTHADGKQTVEEIKNDLGMSEDDESAILANLAEQGLDDICAVEFNSGKKLQVNTMPDSSSTTESEKVSSTPPSTPSRIGRHANANTGHSSLILG